MSPTDPEDWIYFPEVAGQQPSVTDYDALPEHERKERFLHREATIGKEALCAWTVDRKSVRWYDFDRRPNDGKPADIEAADDWVYDLRRCR